jgi:uncharacterized protein
MPTPPEVPSDVMPPEVPEVDALAPANKSENTLGILMHIIPALGLFLWIPFLNVVPPLALWLYHRSDSRYLDEHGKEVVNFSIGVGLAMFIGYFACVHWLVAIAGIILAVIGAIEASANKLYRYPLTLRLIK